MKRWFYGILLFFFFFLPVSGQAAALSAWDQAQLFDLSAWISLAAYDDRIGFLARSELTDRGWQLEHFQEKTADAEAKYYLMQHPGFLQGNPAYLLAVTGTESKKDVQVDLKFHKVLFAGTNPAEFAAQAASTTALAKDPQVHAGFDLYTRTAFFTQPYQKDGRTLGEYLRDELKAHPGARLYITGHSLGGAAATLFAARLLAMGVSPVQLQVISFGAPAVGNAAFARAYENLPLTRVVIDGDPVKSLLQSLPSGYVQFGDVHEWQRNRNSEHFHHAMVVYIDAAVRNLYDTRAETIAKGEPVLRQRMQPTIQSSVYVAPYLFTLDEKIGSDQPYMQAASQDLLQDRISGVIFSQKKKETLSESFRAAKKAGCSYVLVEKILGKRMRKAVYDFQMTLQEEIYDTEGNLLFLQEASTDTERMTPIEAILYNQVKTKDGRDRTLGKVPVLPAR